MDDLIKRSDAIKAIKQWLDNDGSLFDVGLNQAIREIKRLPSAEEEEFEWCHDCKEYDQDAHCCHRYSKRIRQAVEEIKADRPQGEWMPFRSEEWISPIADFYKCSICGKRVNLLQMRSYNFCPNCGAHMKGANDE